MFCQLPFRDLHFLLWAKNTVSVFFFSFFFKKKFKMFWHFHIRKYCYSEMKYFHTTTTVLTFKFSGCMHIFLFKKKSVAILEWWAEMNFTCCYRSIQFSSECVISIDSLIWPTYSGLYYSKMYCYDQVFYNRNIFVRSLRKCRSSRSELCEKSSRPAPIREVYNFYKQ